MPQSHKRSLVPIITMSMPSTATISSALASAAAFSNWTITMVASLSAADASAAGKLEMQVGQPARNRAGAERQEFRRLDHGAGLLRRADMGRDHAKRAAFEHPRDVFGRVGGHSHERRDAGCQR